MIKPKLYKNFNRGQWALLKIDEVKNLMPNNEVSDVGAGFGWFGEALRKRDFDYKAFDRIKKNENTIIWDLNSPAPKNVQKAGAIVMLEVIEHLENPVLALKHISQHLEHNGFLILSSPNPFSARNKFFQIFYNQFYAFQPKHLEEHHVYIPLPHILQYHLEKYDLKLIEYGVLSHKENVKVRFGMKTIKDFTRHLLESILSLGNDAVKGQTQVFLFKKVRENDII